MRYLLVAILVSFGLVLVFLVFRFLVDYVKNYFISQSSNIENKSRQKIYENLKSVALSYIFRLYGDESKYTKYII